MEGVENLETLSKGTVILRYYRYSVHKRYVMLQKWPFDHAIETLNSSGIHKNTESPMKVRAAISLPAVLALLTVGIGLILYGNTLPKDINMFSDAGTLLWKESSVLLIGEIITSLSAIFLAWWILERTKKTSTKENTSPSTCQGFSKQ